MIIRESIAYFTIICLLQVACNSHSANNATDSATIILKAAESVPIAATTSIDALMQAVDSVVGNIKAQHFDRQAAYLPPIHPNDTLFTQLYFKDKIPARLSYTTFEESGQPSGIAYFYFNDLFSIIHERTFADEVVYAVVMRDGKYFSFSKSIKDNSLKLEETPEKDIDFSRGGFLKYVYDLIQLYSDFKFDIPIVKLKGDFPLRVIQPVTLYKAADASSKIIGILPKYTRLGYLGSSRERVDLKGKNWIWYKVKRGDEVGWVVGHPEWVEEVTGEDRD